jgi:septal ring factor EnvC (AmiA/AmiB activator)
VASVIEDLKRLEERILARIQELEASVAELEQFREVAVRLGMLEEKRGDSRPATRAATATARPRRAAVGRASGLLHKDGRRLWPVST